MKRVNLSDIDYFKESINKLIKNVSIYEKIIKTIDGFSDDELFLHDSSLYFKNTSLGINKPELIGKKDNEMFILAIELDKNSKEEYNFVGFYQTNGSESYNVIIKFLSDNLLDVEIKNKFNGFNSKTIHRIYASNKLIYETKDEIKNNIKEVYRSTTYVNDENIAFISTYNSLSGRINYKKIVNYINLFNDREKRSNLCFKIGPSNLEEFNRAKRKIKR